MKSNTLKFVVALLLATIVASCTNTTKTTDSTKTADTQKAPVATHDTIYPQFPGGIEALDKHLKEIKDYIILEIDEKGKTTYTNYGNRLPTNDDNTIKTINALPNWTPGTLDGNPARFCYIYSNDPKHTINKCISIGRQSERHKLAKYWTLSNIGNEGAENHPIYKGRKFVSLTINLYYQLLQKIDKEDSREVQIDISDTKNEFTIEYNDSTIITYRYSLNETNNTLTTFYTDANGKEQTLVWKNDNYRIPTPPNFPKKTIVITEKDIEPNK